MNNITLEENWQIAAVLANKVNLLRIQKDAPSFEFLGKRFEDVGLGYHNGFYDFLRNPSGAILGVRFFPSREALLALKRVGNCEGVVHTNEAKAPTMLIFWETARDFDPGPPCDQYFGNNFIYRAPKSGKLAIGFGVDILNIQEKVSLSELNANHGP